MRATLVLSLVVVLHTGLAQDRGYHGVLVDSDGNVWVGKFQMIKEVAVLTKHQGVEIFPAWRTRELRWYDSLKNLNRRWITRPAKSGEQRYYEVVVEGPIKIVRSCKDVAMDSDTDYCYYYIENDIVTRLSRFRARLYKRIRPQPDCGNLNPNNPDDAIRYIQLYNQALRIAGSPGAH